MIVAALGSDGLGSDGLALAFALGSDGLGSDGLALAFGGLAIPLRLCFDSSLESSDKETGTHLFFAGAGGGGAFGIS
jgi:hypothetical protein